MVKKVDEKKTALYIDTILQDIRVGMSVKQSIEANGLPVSNAWFHLKRQEIEGLDARWIEAKQAGCWALQDSFDDDFDAVRELVLKTKEETTPDGQVLTVPMYDAKQMGVLAKIAKDKVDTRKWSMSKLLPKSFGDKVQLTDGEGDALPVVWFSKDAPPDG